MDRIATCKEIITTFVFLKRWSKFYEKKFFEPFVGAFFDCGFV